MLTGQSPFERPTPNLIIAAHLRDAPPPLHELRPEIPADLSLIIDRCLQKDPTQRYPDAPSLEIALAKCQCAGNTPYSSP